MVVKDSSQTEERKMRLMKTLDHRRCVTEPRPKSTTKVTPKTAVNRILLKKRKKIVSNLVSHRSSPTPFNHSVSWMTCASKTHHNGKSIITSKNPTMEWISNPRSMTPSTSSMISVSSRIVIIMVALFPQSSILKTANRDSTYVVATLWGTTKVQSNNRCKVTTAKWVARILSWINEPIMNRK